MSDLFKSAELLEIEKKVIDLEKNRPWDARKKEYKATDREIASLTTQAEKLIASKTQQYLQDNGYTIDESGYLFDPESKLQLRIYPHFHYQGYREKNCVAHAVISSNLSRAGSFNKDSICVEHNDQDTLKKINDFFNSEKTKWIEESRRHAIQVHNQNVLNEQMNVKNLPFAENQWKVNYLTNEGSHRLGDGGGMYEVDCFYERVTFDARLRVISDNPEEIVAITKAFDKFVKSCTNLKEEPQHKIGE